MESEAQRARDRTIERMRNPQRHERLDEAEQAREYRRMNPWLAWMDPYGVYQKAQQKPRPTLREDSAPPPQGAQHARARVIARMTHSPLPPPPVKTVFRQDAADEGVAWSVGHPDFPGRGED